MNTTTATSGTKCYLDSFAGLVPAVAVSVADSGNGVGGKITIRITALRNRAYRRGEIVETNGLHAVPRNHVFTRSGQYRIRGGYTWV